MRHKASAPLADRRLVNPQIGCNLLVLNSRRTTQHDPCPKRQGLRRIVSSRQRSQLRPLVIAQNQCRKSSPRHNPLHAAISLTWRMNLQYGEV
jgi:hypothetical protein